MNSQVEEMKKRFFELGVFKNDELNIKIKNLEDEVNNVGKSYDFKKTVDLSKSIILLKEDLNIKDN